MILTRTTSGTSSLGPCCRLQTGSGRPGGGRFALDFVYDESPQQVGPARSSEASGGQCVKHHCFTRAKAPLSLGQVDVQEVQ